MKGVAPHGWYATSEDREANWPSVDFAGKPSWWLKWSNADLEYKPARRFFTEPCDLETKSGVKVEGLTLTMPPDQYAKVPGKDPDGRFDGPTGTKWNSFEYFATYCAQDVRVLAEHIWEPWRAAVLNATRYVGKEETHAILAAPPITVLSIDPGWQTGYCLLHFDGDAWGSCSRVARCAASPP
jgi:hypothetical protein